MREQQFSQLVESLEVVRAHVTTGQFAGRLSAAAVAPDDIRRLRARSGMTQAQFAATFGIGLGTLQKWERGERRPSGAAKSLLRVMQADTPAVVRALGIMPVQPAATNCDSSLQPRFCSSR
jgi:putative transcriptional regulator